MAENPDINPLSGYDLVYHGMSDEDRGRLQDDISAILSGSITGPLATLKKAIQSAAEELTFGIIVNPWPEWLDENANECEFARSLAMHIWRSMLKAKPSKLGEWQMRELFQSMLEKHPEELTEILNDELIRENHQLKEALAFERNVTRELYR